LAVPPTDVTVRTFIGLLRRGLSHGYKAHYSGLINASVGALGHVGGRTRHFRGYWPACSYRVVSIKSTWLEWCHCDIHILRKESRNRRSKIMPSSKTFFTETAGIRPGWIPEMAWMDRWRQVHVSLWCVTGPFLLERLTIIANAAAADDDRRWARHCDLQYGNDGICVILQKKNSAYGTVIPFVRMTK
jgi:hypothetical protein